MMRAVLPAMFGLVLLVLWETVIRLNDVPPYIMPAPSAILEALWTNAPDLLAGLAVTLEVTFAALALAVGTGVAIAVILASSPVAERTFFPYAVFLQVTPIVTVALPSFTFAVATFGNVSVVMIALAASRNAPGAACATRSPITP